MAPAVYVITQGHNYSPGEGNPIAAIDSTHQSVTFQAYLPPGSYLADLTVGARVDDHGDSTHNFSYNLIRCAVSGAYADGEGEIAAVGDRAWFGSDGRGGDSYGRDLGQRPYVTFHDATPVTWPGQSTEEVATCGRAGIDASAPASSRVDILYLRLVATAISGFQTNPRQPPAATPHRQPLTNVREHLPTQIRRPATTVHVHN